MHSTLTPAELLNDIGGPQTTQVSATEATKQTDTRSKTFGSWRDKSGKFWALAIQNDGDQSTSCLSQLMDDVDSVYETGVT